MTLSPERQALNSAYLLELLYRDSSMGHKGDSRRQFCLEGAGHIRRLLVENEALRAELAAAQEARGSRAVLRALLRPGSGS